MPAEKVEVMQLKAGAGKNGCNYLVGDSFPSSSVTARLQLDSNLILTTQDLGKLILLLQLVVGTGIVSIRTHVVLLVVTAAPSPVTAVSLVSPPTAPYLYICWFAFHKKFQGMRWRTADYSSLAARVSQTAGSAFLLSLTSCFPWCR